MKFIALKYQSLASHWPHMGPASQHELNAEDIVRGPVGFSNCRVALRHPDRMQPAALPTVHCDAGLTDDH